MTGIVFLDGDFKPMSAPVDNFTSLIWTSRYYQHGSASAVLPISKYNAIKTASYIYNPDNKKCCLFSRLNLTSAGGTVTVGGFMLEALFDRRIITAETKLTGNVETAVRSLVASALAGDRAIDGLVLADAAGYTETTESSIEAGTKLSDALYTTLKPFGLSYSITLDYEAGTIKFSVIKGLDRTQRQSANSWATFSTDFENLQSIEYTHNEDDAANFAYVSANDATHGAVTVEVDLSDSAERREIFVSTGASSKKADDSDMTLEEYQDLLVSVGKGALYANKAVDDVSGGVDTQGSLKYRVNYNLGDWCDVIAPEQSLSWAAQITAVDEVYEGDSKIIKPSFGESADNLRGLIKKEMNKSRVVIISGGGGGGGSTNPYNDALMVFPFNQALTNLKNAEYTISRQAGDDPAYYNSEPFGYCLSLANKCHYAASANLINKLNAPFTLSAWVYFNNTGLSPTPGWRRVLWGTLSGAYFPMPEIAYSSSTISTNKYSIGGTTLTTVAAYDSAWHWICLTRTSFGFRLYVDKSAEILLIEKSLSNLFTTSLNINHNGYALNGYMHYLCFWDRVLSDSEMLYLWNNGNGNFI